MVSRKFEIDGDIHAAATIFIWHVNHHRKAMCFDLLSGNGGRLLRRAVVPLLNGYTLADLIQAFEERVAIPAHPDPNEYHISTFFARHIPVPKPDDWTPDGKAYRIPFDFAPPKWVANQGESR